MRAMLLAALVSAALYADPVDGFAIRYNEGDLQVLNQQKLPHQVYACETRPLLQGGRLTAWEMEKNQIPFTLICDSMAATLMREGKFDLSSFLE